MPDFLPEFVREMLPDQPLEFQHEFSHLEVARLCGGYLTDSEPNAIYWSGLH